LEAARPMPSSILATLVNDMIVIIDNQPTPFSWRLGCILKLLPGNDGVNFKKSLNKTKSEQAAGSGRKYIYVRQLSFLQTAGATTETQSSFGNDEIKE